MTRYKAEFDRYANKPFEPKSNPGAKAKPFSIRLTAEERTYLERKAGKKPLSQYAREHLLGSAGAKRKTSQRPSADKEILAQLLGTLGQSQLGPSMDRIAGLAEKGALPLSPELSQEVCQACFEIAAMRVALIKALDLKA
ncbi:MAG: hypothetical protein AAF862_05250 [Pseudomonadota bacterium]